jgi:cytidylate kinase
MHRFYDMSNAKAKQAVMAGEKKRRNLYARMDRQDYNEPNLYHLVINMSRLSLEQAMKLILDLATG